MRALSHGHRLRSSTPLSQIRIFRYFVSSSIDFLQAIEIEQDNNKQLRTLRINRRADRYTDERTK